VPSNTSFLCISGKLLSHEPDWFVVLIGILKTKVKLTVFHINLAKGQLKKGCWIVSSSLQIQQEVHSFHCLWQDCPWSELHLAYHRKILILRGFLSFHVEQSTNTYSILIQQIIVQDLHWKHLTYSPNERVLMLSKPHLKNTPHQTNPFVPISPTTDHLKLKKLQDE
jgi:hypothetical protein